MAIKTEMSPDLAQPSPTFAPKHKNQKLWDS